MGEGLLMDIFNILMVLVGSLAMMGMLFGLAIVVFALIGAVGQIAIGAIDAVSRAWDRISP